jgi:hypothetical protein
MFPEKQRALPIAIPLGLRMAMDSAGIGQPDGAGGRLSHSQMVALTLGLDTMQAVALRNLAVIAGLSPQ